MNPVRPGRLPGESLDGLPPGRLVVAVSGGMDSMVLLHRLRFGPGPERELHLAHLDHALRPGSAGDAHWIRGVARAWGLPATVRRLSVPPSGEAEAREARYAFLREVGDAVGAAALVVAHHADDQAETVLFRILRGTGLRGLEGMRSPAGEVVRPFLGVWRDALEAYRRRWGVPVREDPTNRSRAFARNVLRHDVIPAAEAGVAAGARRSLVRLAGNARDVHEELAEHRARLLQAFRLPAGDADPVHPNPRGAGERGGGLPGALARRLELRADGLAGLPEVLRRQLIRDAAVALGVTLDRRGSVLAGRALAELHAGQGLDLTGGLRLERGLDRWIVLAPGAAAGHRERRRRAAGSGLPQRQGREPLVVVRGGADEPRTRELRLGPRSYRLAWSREGPDGPGAAAFGAPHLPVAFRGWRAGDRLRGEAGEPPVAKLLAQAGVSALDRPDTLVGVDGEDRVLWIPDLARTAADLPPAGAHPNSDDRIFMTCTRIEG